MTIIVARPIEYAFVVSFMSVPVWWERSQDTVVAVKLVSVYLIWPDFKMLSELTFNDYFEISKMFTLKETKGVYIE